MAEKNEYRITWGITFANRLAQLPGTDRLICKSCATTLTAAMDASYQAEFKKHRGKNNVR